MSEARPANPELVRELRFLGIAEDSWPVLALLPMVQVAWADGTIQTAERALILQAAQRFQVDEEGERLLEGWLSHAPTEHYMQRGREALRLLAAHFPDLARIDTVIDLSQAVAEAAGGLFGLRPVDPREATVLKALSHHLALVPERRFDWDDVLAVDDEEDDLDEEAIPMEAADALEDDPSVPTIRVIFQAGHGPRAADGATLVRMDDDRVAPLLLPVGGVTLGRSRACNVRIASDAKVSRHHARIYREGTSWRIQDHGSTTGTWVNEERVVDRRLFGDERIQTGDVIFRFEIRA